MVFNIQAHQEPLGKVISIFQNILFQPLKVVQVHVMGKLEPFGKMLCVISQGKLRPSSGVSEELCI